MVKVGEDDSVIIMTHEPNWILDWYWSDVSGKNVSHLTRDYLKGRCKLRIAGDLHHYMRHSVVKSDGPVHVHHLLVNGCGGAFLHPTHVFANFKNLYGASYDCKAAYPSFEDSSRVMFGYSFFFFFTCIVDYFICLKNGIIFCVLPSRRLHLVIY